MPSETQRQQDSDNKQQRQDTARQAHQSKAKTEKTKHGQAWRSDPQCLGVGFCLRGIWETKRR